MQYKRGQLFNKSPPLPCVESKPLTHSLASIASLLWLLGFTALTCLVSGNHTFLSRFEVAI